MRCAAVPRRRDARRWPSPSPSPRWGGATASLRAARRRLLTSAPMDRRRFLASTSGMGMALALGTSFWERALAAPAQPGASPYGPLLAADANGVQLPGGLHSRVVARSLTPGAGTTYPWHPFPDGGVLRRHGRRRVVLRLEQREPAARRRPAAAGRQRRPRRRVRRPRRRVGHPVRRRRQRRRRLPGPRRHPQQLLRRAHAVGHVAVVRGVRGRRPTPAAAYAGRAGVRVRPGRPAPASSDRRSAVFKHEMAAVDPERHQIYLSEDLPDGLFYRYTAPPGVWGSGAALEGGTLEAMAVAADGAVTWLPVAERRGADRAAAHVGARGHDLRRRRGRGLRQRPHLPDDEGRRPGVGARRRRPDDGGALRRRRVRRPPVLNGVDNIIASKAHDLYVAEDGGNLEVNIITPDLVVAPGRAPHRPEHGVRQRRRRSRRRRR